MTVVLFDLDACPQVPPELTEFLADDERRAVGGTAVAALRRSSDCRAPESAGVSARA